MPPEVFIATHNGQVLPGEHRGAFDNLLPLGEALDQVLGIRLVNEIVEKYPAVFPTARHILLSGGGYQQVPAKHGPFRWADFAELESLAGSLSLGKSLYGLTPGEVFSWDHECVR